MYLLLISGSGADPLCEISHGHYQYLGKLPGTVLKVTPKVLADIGITLKLSRDSFHTSRNSLIWIEREKCPSK